MNENRYLYRRLRLLDGKSSGTNLGRSLSNRPKLQPVPNLCKQGGGIPQRACEINFDELEEVKDDHPECSAEQIKFFKNYSDEMIPLAPKGMLWPTRWKEKRWTLRMMKSMYH